MQDFICVTCNKTNSIESYKGSIFQLDPSTNECLVFRIYQITKRQIQFDPSKCSICTTCHFHLTQSIWHEKWFLYNLHSDPKNSSRPEFSENAKSAVEQMNFVNDLENYSADKNNVNEKSFACKFCNKRFTKEKTLFLHEKSKHDSEKKKYCCDICPKKFEFLSQKENHDRNHTDERPFKCEQCGKSYKKKIGLKQHEMTHTGEKPYGCKFCGQTFVRLSSCNLHETRHTSKRNKKCKICTLSFKLKVDLDSHVRKQHKSINQMVVKKVKRSPSENEDKINTKIIKTEKDSSFETKRFKRSASENKDSGEK